MVVIEMKNQMKRFEYLENRFKGYHYKHFSKILIDSEYLPYGVSEVNRETIIPQFWQKNSTMIAGSFKYFLLEPSAIIPDSTAELCKSDEPNLLPMIDRN